MIIDLEARIKEKMRSDDRVLVLKPIDGKAPLNTKGIVDNRLFKGENSLHAKRDPSGVSWYLEYEYGMLQEPLKQRFTSFQKLYDFVKAYFNKRNIEIVEVKD